MSSFSPLIEKIKKNCQGIIKIEVLFQECIITIDPLHWHDNAKFLQNSCGMTTLIDLCGVDYAFFEMTNWTTKTATQTGFSRSVFDFDQEKQAEKIKENNRFCVVYQLLDIVDNLRVRIKIYPTESDYPKVDSVVDVWQGANWYEREVFDLYGILFANHPDLRRILTDYGFVGHPLRKDFPLEGHVEMIYDPEKKQVVYQPVSIKPRVNIPKVIRDN